MSCLLISTPRRLAAVARSLALRPCSHAPLWPHPAQAELGVGDCGGLRYIPGMTKSGVQKRPEWMDKLFGMEGEPQE